jgi:Rv0078B-related antitoxin
MISQLGAPAANRSRRRSVQAIQASFGTVYLHPRQERPRKYHGTMIGTGGFRLLLARFTESRAMAQPRAFHWTLEAQRMRSALDMHDLGVQLYRQRMRREHPDASRDEIESLVRTWLTAPSPDTRLRLPSRGSRGLAG